jgi:hypothetical protein
VIAFLYPSASLAAEVVDQGEDDALVSVLLEEVAGVREPQHLGIGDVFSQSCSSTFLREGDVLQPAHTPETSVRPPASTSMCSPCSALSRARMALVAATVREG